MVSWRPIRGTVLLLDTELASPRQVEDFLTERRVIARGAFEPDTVRLEVVASGRRRRVAVLDDAGEVVPGPTLAELVQEMNTAIRKLKIDLGGVAAGGNIDLGEIDVTGDDPILAAEQVGVPVLSEAGAGGAAEGSAVDVVQSAGSTAEAGSVEGDTGSLGDGPGQGVGLADEPTADETLADDEPFDYGEGPILVVSDIPLADMPGLAVQVGRSVAVLRHGSVTTIMAEAESGDSRDVDVKSSFSVVFSADPSGLDAPVVGLRSHGWRLTWDWSDDLDVLPWVADDPAAAEFAQHRLGAGALAYRIARKVPDVDAEAVVAVLEGPANEAPAAFVRAMGLPVEAGDVLAGLLRPEAVPGVLVFEPRPLGQRLQTSVAYELVGEGNSKTGLWQFYRRAFVDHPRVTEVVASVQAGVGAVVLVNGLRSKSMAGRIAATAGAALVANAGARIVTTQWLLAALKSHGLSTTPEE